MCQTLLKNLVDSACYVEDVLWKQEARSPRRGTSAPSCSESRADSLTVTLYFRFHSESRQTLAAFSFLTEHSRPLFHFHQEAMTFCQLVLITLL